MASGQRGGEPEAREAEARLKISHSLKGRIQSDLEKANHVLGAHKKKFIVMIEKVMLCY